MAKKKGPVLLKYPKKPKMSASTLVKERYLGKCQDVKKENARRISEYEKSLKHEQHINGLLQKFEGKYTTSIKYGRKSPRRNPRGFTNY